VGHGVLLWLNIWWWNSNWAQFTGLTANTISSTNYLNLPTDVSVTGGTYSNGTAIFANTTGGTFNLTE
jgi:hypothetical protein